MGGIIVGDPARQIIDRLDTQNMLLARLIDVIVQNMGGPGAVQMLGVNRRLLETLVAVTLPSAPRDTQEFTVGVNEIMLAENGATNLARVTITNDDPAQNLWISGRGVLITTGAIILPQFHESYILPAGSSIWGVCAVATISVRVATGYDLYAEVVQG